MVFARSERPRLPTAIKILVAGGFGAGKTTMVGAVSETRPLRTEEVLTDRGIGVDDLTSVEAKRTTTVAMDFGRITLGSDYVLYLFGTPGQERFWFVWDEAGRGLPGRGHPGRHPAAGRLLPVGRLLRAARDAVRGGGQLLRGGADVRAGRGAPGAAAQPVRSDHHV